MTFAHGLLALLTWLLLLVLLDAAPQRRNCLSTLLTTDSSVQVLGSSSMQAEATGFTTGTGSLSSALSLDSAFTSFKQVNSPSAAITDVDTPTNTIINVDDDGDPFTVQNIQLSDTITTTTNPDPVTTTSASIDTDIDTASTSIPSRIVLIYDNQTITDTLPTLFPNPTPQSSPSPTKLQTHNNSLFAAAAASSSSTNKTTTTTITTNKHTSSSSSSPHKSSTTHAQSPTQLPTPTITTIQTLLTQTIYDIASMQTAYYLSVCGWPEHADDAICLSENTMLCCRGDNPKCNYLNGVLADGGLSCKGVESGNWAKVWTRPTVTASVK